MTIVLQSSGHFMTFVIFASLIYVMSFIFFLILIGIAVYYISKWQSSAPKQKTTSNFNNPNQGQQAPKNPSGNSSNSHTNYGKWVGGGLGWAFGGPIGGILGFALGSMFQGGQSGQGYRIGMPTQTGDFNVSLLVLTAAVMKADGTVKKSELDYVKSFYVQNFGVEASKRYIKTLGEILKHDINVEDVSRQIGRFMDYSSRLQLMHYLFGIALADGVAGKAEVNLISEIAGTMGIGVADFQSLKAMFVKDTDSAYKILEIAPEATDEEVKFAYREMAKKYHPDLVSHLGEDIQGAAEKKFQTVNEAYEAIKKERGFK